MTPAITQLPALKSSPRQQHFDACTARLAPRTIVLASTAAQVRKWASRQWGVSQQKIIIRERPDLDPPDPIVTARRACLLLAGFAYGSDYSLFLMPLHREAILALVTQFDRMDRAELKRLATARAQGSHGVKGGRPRRL